MVESAKKRKERLAKKGKPLSKRSDKAAELAKDAVRTIIKNVFELNEYRNKLADERKNAFRDFKKKYDDKIDAIDKDVYHFENAARLMVGNTDYYYFKKEYKDLLIKDMAKPKSIKTKEDYDQQRQPKQDEE